MSKLAFLTALAVASLGHQTFAAATHLLACMLVQGCRVSGSAWSQGPGEAGERAGAEVCEEATDAIRHDYR